MMRIHGETVVVERERILGHFMGATDSFGGRIFCGKPASPRIKSGASFFRKMLLMP
jgi:hypothetical protein